MSKVVCDRRNRSLTVDGSVKIVDWYCMNLQLFGGSSLTETWFNH